MNRMELLAVVSLGAALASGFLTLPRALEPGRSEQNGITLNLLVDVGDGRVTNDWFSAGGARIESSREMRVEASRDGAQVISRPMAVYPGECYLMDLTLRAEKGTVVILLQDEDMKTTITSRQLPADAEDVRVNFSSGPFRRVTVVLASDAEAVFALGSADLMRIGRSASCG
jgi:hypothetical protein